MPDKRSADRDTATLSARVPETLAKAYRQAATDTGRAQNRLILEALTLYAGVLGVGWMLAPDPTLADRRTANPPD